VGWHRGCTNIAYLANNIKKDLLSNKTYYSLTFTYEFEYDQDTVFFSYCYPYTYSDLVEDLIQIDLDPLKNQYVIAH
jgi:cytosolic carboxypeptidase protein 2/3